MQVLYYASGKKSRGIYQKIYGIQQSDMLRRERMQSSTKVCFARLKNRSCNEDSGSDREPNLDKG
jgi:hypothetical protein